MTDGVAAAPAAPAGDSFSAVSGGLDVGSASSFDSALGSALSSNALTGGTDLSSGLFSPAPLATDNSFGLSGGTPTLSTPSLFDPTPLAPGIQTGFSSPFNFSSAQPGAFTGLSSAFGPTPVADAPAETPGLLGRIGDRIGTNFDRMFATPLGPGQEYRDLVAPFTQPTGTWTDNVTWPFRMFNDALLNGAPAAIDGGLRTIGATYHSLVDTGVETAVSLGMERGSAERLGRDIHAMPEAFAGMAPGALAMRTGPIRAAEPGAWQAVNESMSARAAAYQAQITGRQGEVYTVGGVRFDGFDGRGLVDAKGPGYATFVRDGEFRSWFSGADDLVAQAQRQLNVAGGQPITWHVAEAEAATAMRNLLQERGIQGITIVHTPAN